MSFSWSPRDILAVCENEADLAPLEAAGFKAILQPDADDLSPLPKAGHYVMIANGKSMTSPTSW